VWTKEALNLDKPFSNYWKPWEEIEKTKREANPSDEILAHQAGLVPYICIFRKK